MSQESCQTPVASVWARTAPSSRPLPPAAPATSRRPGHGDALLPVGSGKHFLPVRQVHLCVRCLAVLVASLDTCHLSGWSSPRHAWQQALVDRQPSWDRMDGYEPRRRCWRIGAGRTEGHHLYCISLCLMDHNYNTWNVCGDCFPEVHSPVGYCTHFC